MSFFVVCCWLVVEARENYVIFLGSFMKFSHFHW